jgi:hypothetical protein
LPEAKEEAGTDQAELVAQTDDIKSLKAENESEARNNEEELAVFVDEIKTSRDAKESEPHNDHGELAARLEEIMKKLLEALLIIVNTYTEPKSKLGAGPLTESLVIAREHVKCGFQAFFLPNSAPTIVMEWLLHFLHKVGKKLTIFYTGRGAHVKDLNGDESDGFDEAIVFDDDHMLDNDFGEALVQNATEKARIALLSDCCHTGSVEDMQSKRLKGQQKGPPNVMPMRSTEKSQTAKQMTVDHSHRVYSRSFPGMFAERTRRFL